MRSEIKLEFLGSSGNNPFVANVSSPRAVMDSNHMSQTLSLLTPTENIVKTGIEYELGKYINDKKTRYDSLVKGVVEKHPNAGRKNPTWLVFLEYEKDGRLYLDIEEINSHESTHNFFGYETNPTPELINAGYNTVLPKETNLTRTNTLSDTGSYMYGRTANIVFMSAPPVAEDGIVISESFAKKCSFLSVTERVIDIDKDTIPLNLYGKGDEYKFIPDIGEKVREDGLLCAYRENDPWLCVADFEDENLREADPVFDINCYVGTDAEVIDIEVIRGDADRLGLPEKMVEQLEKYSGAMTSYYERAISMYRNILKERRRGSGRADNYNLAPKLIRFINDAMMITEAQNRGRIKLNYKMAPIKGYRVVVKTRSKMSLNLGYKLTGLNADKGVVCKIMKDEDMPVDEWGVRAEVIMDDTSTISRMNLGRAYEPYLGAVSRDNRERIKKMCEGGLNKAKVAEVTAYLRGLYELINPDMVEFIDGLDESGRKSHIEDILKTELYIYYPPDNARNIIDVCRDIRDSIYRPNVGKVTYRALDGRMTTTKEDVIIKRMYIMVLEKVGVDFSAVNTAKVNNYGFPIRSTNQIDKFKTPHAISPTKTLGETEVRILMSFAGPEMLIDMIDYNLNLKSLKLLIGGILEDERPFGNDYAIDRRYNNYGQTKSLSMLKHLFSGYGINIAYKKKGD